MPFSEIKSYVMSFYIKMIKIRTLHVSSSNHSIKKDILFSLGQIEIILVRQEGGGSLPPSPLDYGPVLVFIIFFRAFSGLTHLMNFI